ELYGDTDCSVEGVYGKACSFDGVDDYVETEADDSLNITSDFSIFAWIKAKEDTENYHQIVGQYKYVDPSGYGYSLYLSEGNLRVNIYAGTNGDNGADAIGENDLRDNLWHYVGFTFDGNIIRVYENGVEVDTDGFSFYPELLDNKVTVGFRSIYSDLPFNGLIDELMIFDKALTEDEVEWLYEGDLS
ncbi:MAG: LamG domain-containing protein, partial [Candidatus Pacearchaeota archaeon]|nr:LamG domain-containing protein [Candidatus Pacearchaeota archaeon]